MMPTDDGKKKIDLDTVQFARVIKIDLIIPYDKVIHTAKVVFGAVLLHIKPSD